MPKSVLFGRLPLGALLFLFLFGSTLLSAQISCSIQSDDPSPVCQRSVVTYTAVGVPASLSLKWVTPGGNQIPSGNSVTVTWNTVGTSSVTAIFFDETGAITGSCFVPVEILELPSPRIIDAPIPGCKNTESAKYCSNTTLQFSASGGGGNYSWSVQGNAAQTSSNQGNTFGVTTGASGQFTIQLSESNAAGCVGTTRVTYGILPPPIATITERSHGSADPIEVCIGEKLFFAGTSSDPQASELIWEVFSGPTRVASGSGNTFSHSFGQQGIYTVRFTARNCAGCIGTDNVTVNVNEGLVPNIECPSVVCQNGPLVKYRTNAVCDTYHWNVDGGIIAPGNGITTGQGTKCIEVQWTTVPPSGLGTVTLTTGGCPAGTCSQPVTVEVPILNASVQIKGPSSSCDPNAFLPYSLPKWLGAAYEWSLRDDSPLTGSVNTNNNISNPNTFNVLLENFTGSFHVHAVVTHALAGCRFEYDLLVVVANHEVVKAPAYCWGTDVTLSINPGRPAGASITWKVADPSGVNNLWSSPPLMSDEVTIPAAVFPGVSGTFFTVTASIELDDNNKTVLNCISSNIRILPRVEPVVEILGPKNICLHQPYSYTALPGGDITWAVNGGSPTSSTVNPVSVTWTSSSPPYQLTATRSQSFVIINAPNKVCYSQPFTRSDIMRIVPPMTLTIVPATSGQPCADREFTYEANYDGGVDYKWSINPIFGSITSGQGTPKVTIYWNLPLGNNNQAVIHLSAKVCDELLAADLPQTIIEGPSPVIDGPKGVCEGTDAVFTATAFTGATYAWVLENNGTLRSYTTNVPTLVIPASDLTAGPSVVRVTATSTGDCVGSSGDAFQFTVVANPQPGISTPDVPLCNGDEPAPFEITLFGQDYPKALEATFTWTHNTATVSTSSTHTVEINDPLNDPDYGAYLLTVSRTFKEYSNLVCTATSDAYVVDAPDCDPPVLTPPVYFQEWHFEECGTVRVIGAVEVENWEEQVQDAEWVVEDFTGTVQPNPKKIINYEGLNTTLSVFSKPGFYPTWLRVQFEDFDQYSSDRKVIEIPAVPNFKWDAACGSDASTYNVNFTDLTETIPGGATVYNWAWSIDGTEYQRSGTEPNFNYIFTRGQFAKSYKVCLSISSKTAFYQDGIPYTCEICKTITIPGKPDVSILPKNANVCVAAPIQFNATYNPNDILDLTWDFGDGTGSKVANPIKVFEVAGAHTITTTFKDIYGCSFAEQVIVQVHANTLEGNIVATPGDCNSMVCLELASAPAGVTYSWNYQAATTPKILVEQSGVYNVTITDPQTGCMYSPKPVEVVLQSPFISGILGPRRICRGANLELSVTPVSGYTYKWTNSITTGVTTGPKMTILAASIPNNVNSITVTVTAMQNGHDCSVRSVVVHIDPVPNEPGISYNYACPPYPITLSAQNTANTPPTPLNVYWASTTNGAINPLGFGPQVNIFSSGVVRAIVTNEFGCEKYKEVSLAGTPKIEMLTGCYALCEEDFAANNYVLRATLTGGPIIGYEWFVGGTPLLRVNGVDIRSAALTLAAHHAGKKIFLRVYKRFTNSDGSQQECSFDSDVFCFELKTCVSCTPPPSQVHNVICIQNDPAKKQYYVKWTHTPVDGIVRPCAVNAADLIIRNSSNVPIGRFVLLTYEAAGLNWDFEGTIVLEDGNELSYQEACWDIPFCLVSNGLPCGVSKVCTNPNTPFAPCVDPHCPPEKFKWDMGVRCGGSNGAAYHVDLSLSYEDIPVASTGCNAYDVLITSRSGNMNNGISLKGIHADANGDLVMNPTLFPPLSFDWFEGPGGIGTDIICLEVRIRYHDLCWPEPNPTLICKQYFCVDPSKLNCVPSDLPPAYSFSAQCIQVGDVGYEYNYVVDFLNENNITKCVVANSNPNGTNTINSFAGKRVNGHYISQNGNLDFEDIFTINGQNIYQVKSTLPACTPGIGGDGPGAGDGGRESMPLLKSTVEGSLQLMPNPTSGHIMFNYAFPIESIEASRGLVIANALGVAVQQFDLSHMSHSGVINYEVSNLPTGVYQVYLLDQKQVVSIKKMVVLKN